MKILAFCVALVFLPLTGLVANQMPALGAADGGIVCKKWDSRGTICIVYAQDEPAGQQPASHTGKKNRGAAKGKPECHQRGPANYEVPCVTENGYWSDANQCWLKLTQPQPAKDSWLWRGKTTGLIYDCTPPGLSGGAFFAQARVLTVPIWLPSPPAGAPISPLEAANIVARSLGIKEPEIQIAPQSDQAQLAYVGVPLWLWADRSPTTTGPLPPVTRTVDGLSVNARASLENIVWQMGDGTTLPPCGAGTPFSTRDAGKPSPTCGHVYQHTSVDEPGKAYTVTATSHWSVDWTAGGANGEIDLTFSSTAQLRVGEIQALITG